MADIFVSYASQDRAQVVPLVAALEAQGWSVWWDREITPGQEFDRLISDQIDAAKAVVVVWTSTSVESRWVRGEAREAADRGILAPVRFDDARLPIDVRAIHTTDLGDWTGDAAHAGFRGLCRALSAYLESGPAPAVQRATAKPQVPAPKKLSICVLPFANKSDDPEQEYFSDGICEDIITDLSKVSALSVASRNSAFGFKGKNLPIRQVAQQLGVSHILEGSVRKAGERVRITAQLIEAKSDSHLWAERYDRNFSDIFALQDEISEAIVSALRVTLLPEEKKAIEQRGTENTEAYELYLMARQYSLTGNVGSRHQNELIVRLCQRATEIDPHYARAWALMANATATLQLASGATADGGLAAAERALALDPGLAEAHAAMGRVLTQREHYDDAYAEIKTALQMDAESYEVNLAAARWYFSRRQTQRAIDYFAKAAQIVDSDYYCAGMLMVNYVVVGAMDKAVEAARRTRVRTEKIVEMEPDNGSAIGYLVTSLILLEEIEKAMGWMERAILLDPDNTTMRYNFCCDLVLMKEYDAALDLLETTTKDMTRENLTWSVADPDLDAVREHPRYIRMMAEAETRLTESEN